MHKMEIMAKGSIMQDFLAMAQKRYSCRNFLSQTVDDSAIQTILEAGRVAPTCVNRQPWHAWVLQKEADLTRAYTTTSCKFGAPLIIAVGVKPQGGWVRSFDAHDFCDVDGAIVVTHMIFAAQSLGLSSCWVGWFDEPALHTAFPEMQGWRMLALLEIGYASSEGVPHERHFQRKPIVELVDRL